MKFHLVSLELTLGKAQEMVSFSDVTYFWGQMGAGKSSIARLIDYCLGGTIQLSPALQSEFVSAKLTVELEQTTLTSSGSAIPTVYLQPGRVKKALIQSCYRRESPPVKCFLKQV